MLLGIFGAVFAIFIIIFLHELGHFVIARCFGIKVLRFSIGFGKACWRKRAASGTEYVLAIIPLGGYVKMLGENEDVLAHEKSQSFAHKPLLVRMAVVFAGPFVNFLLAVLMYWGFYSFEVVRVKPVIGQIVANSVASRAGLQSQDEILAMNHKPIKDWSAFFTAILTHTGSSDPIELTVQNHLSHKTSTHYLNIRNWQLDPNKPDFFQNMGFFPYSPPAKLKIKGIVPHSSAEKAGLKIHDEIIKFSGNPVNSWEQLVSFIQTKPKEKMVLTVKRQGLEKQIPLQIGTQTGSTKGFLGVEIQPIAWPKDLTWKTHYSFGESFLQSSNKVLQLIGFNFMILGKLVTGKLSFQLLGGPISIFQAAGKASASGLQIYLAFIGFISVAVGVINLLPIPGLDGGHLMFQIIEGLMRRPVPERIKNWGLIFGMMVLIAIMIQATVNDIFRLFS